MSGKAFPLCMDINDKKMTVLGSGIILLFKLLKSLTVNLLLFTGIYAVFGLVTNLMGDYVVYADSNCTGSYCFFRDDASDYSKYHDYATSPIQAWLGLAAIVIWSINMRYMKYSGE